MKTFTRHDKESNSGSRVIVVDKCWECPFADTTKGFGYGWYVTCKLSNKEYHFNDNGCHFSTPHDCPLDFITENILTRVGTIE